MLCDICGKKDAVIHIQQIIGKEIIDVHLCKKCARDKKVTETDSSGSSNIIALIMSLLENKDLKKIVTNNVTRCPTCGTKLSEVKSGGKVGCPDCYREFRVVIRNILGLDASPLLYTGSISSKLQTYRTILIDRERLKRELEEAVKKEDYETAVIIRDKLKDLEVEINAHNA